MSYTKEVTVFCDDCGNWERLTETAVEARKTLRNKGWATVRLEDKTMDYCPDCQSARKKEKQKEKQE